MRLRVYKSRRIAFVFFFFVYVLLRGDSIAPTGFLRRANEKARGVGTAGKKIVAVKAVDAFGEP